MYTDDSVLVTGFAQLPRGTTLYEKNKIIAVVLIINTKENIIEDVEFSFVTELTSYYLNSLIKGMSIRGGMNSIYKKVTKHCHMPSQNAVIQSLRSAWDRYQEINNKL